MSHPFVAPVLSGSISNLEIWASALSCIDVIDVRRTSNKSKKDFSAMLARGEGGRPNDADVERLAAYGHTIVLPEGEPLRRQLGAFTITRGSVDGSTSRAVLGWAIPVGRTLFILYLESARKFDVAGRTRDQSVNAFAEAFRAIVRGAKPDEVHTPLLSRVFRLIDHAVPVMRTLRMYGAQLYAEGKHIPLDTDDDKFLATIQAAMADKDAAATVARLEGDRLTIYGRGEWYLGRHLLPFTWDTEFEMVTDPSTGALVRREIDKHVVVPSERGPELLRMLVRLGGTPDVGRDKIAIALGMKGVVSRAPKHTGQFVTIDKLKHPRSAIDSLCSPEWINAFKTGWYEKEVEFTSDLRASYPQAELRVDEDGRTWLKIRVRMPAPAEGWQVTDAEWEQFEKQQFGTEHQSRGGRSHAKKGRVRPLLGLCQFSDDSEPLQRVVLGFETSGYQLCERTSSLALNEDCSARAWGPEARWVATVNCAAWHKSLAKALLTLGIELADQIVPLRRPEPPILVDDQMDRLTREVREAEAEVKNIEDRQRGIRKQRQQALGNEALSDAELNERIGVLDDDDEEAKRDLGLAQATLRKRQAALDATNANAAPSPAVETAEADFSSLELVIAGLLRYTTTAPAGLAHVIRALLSDSLRWQITAYGTMVAWSATVSLPLRDGSRASREISGVVAKSKGSSRAHLRQEGSERGKQLPRRVIEAPGAYADAYAKRFFLEGCSLVEIERDRGIKPSGGSASPIYRDLRDWLLGHGVVSEDLARAAIDIPILKSRRALYRALVDDGTERLDPFESLIGDVYRNGIPVFGGAGSPSRKLAWGVLWCAAPMLAERRVYDVLRASAVQGVRLSAAAVAGLADVPYTTAGRHRVVGRGVSLLEMANGGRPRRSAGDSGPVLPSFLAKDWAKRDQRPPEQKHVWLWSCLHPRCHGYLLPVPVPEVAGGLLCDNCRRLPHDDLVVFPQEYLLWWSGGRRHRDSSGEHVGTVLWSHEPAGA